MTKVASGRICSHLVNIGLHDVATFEQMIQPFQMLDVGRKMVQEHNVEENSHHLRKRRILVVGTNLLPLLIPASDADRENLFRPQADDRAEGLLQADTAIAEKG